MRDFQENRLRRFPRREHFVCLIAAGIFFAVFFAACPPAPAPELSGHGAEAFYLAAWGSDSNEGTSAAQPLKTLRYAVAEAAEHPSVGTIILMGGLTPASENEDEEPDLGVFRVNGTRGKLITLRGEGPGAARLDGGGGARPVLFVSDSKLLLENIYIVNSVDTGIFMLNSSVTLNGCGVTGNSRGVTVSGGDFTISGETRISGNRPRGGVYVGLGRFTMKSGGIFHNGIKSYEAEGGGVRVYKSEFVMEGGGIFLNEAADSPSARGGGLALSDDSTGFMSGVARIYDNTAAASGGGVFLDGSNFEMDDVAAIENNSLTLLASGGAGKPSGGGGVYMQNSSNLTMRGKSKISGSRAVINNPYTSGGGGVCALENSRVEMHGRSSVERNIMSNINNQAAEGGGVYLSSSVLMMYDEARVAENRADYSGGGVYLSEYRGGIEPVLALYGGASISGNTARHGGGVSVLGAGRVGLYGGSVSSNTAANSAGVSSTGGGLYNLRDASFTMTEGSISDNKVLSSSAGSGGGGAYWGGTFTVSGGSVSANSTVNGDGGGLWISGYGALSMSGNSLVYGEDAAPPVFANRAGGPGGTGHAVYWASPGGGRTRNSTVYGTDTLSTDTQEAPPWDR